MIARGHVLSAHLSRLSIRNSQLYKIIINSVHIDNSKQSRDKIATNSKDGKRKREDNAGSSSGGAR